MELRRVTATGETVSKLNSGVGESVAIVPPYHAPQASGRNQIADGCAARWMLAQGRYDGTLIAPVR